jgi:hypothetical protein
METGFMADIDYAADVKKYAKKVDEDAVAGIVRHCGIALRSRDASMVSCSQKPELERVRESFLKKKLALSDDDAKLDAAIDDVCETMGRSNKNKSRVTFYYLLAEKYGKLDMFVKKSS